MRLVRNDNLASAEEVGIERMCARAEQDQCSRISRHEDRRNAVEQYPFAGQGLHAPQDQHRADGRDDAGAGREKSNEERRSTDDCQSTERQRASARARVPRQKDRPLHHHRQTDDDAEQQEAEPGPASWKCREEALQSVAP